MLSKDSLEFEEGGFVIETKHRDRQFAKSTNKSVEMDFVLTLTRIDRAISRVAPTQLLVEAEFCK